MMQIHINHQKVDSFFQQVGKRFQQRLAEESQKMLTETRRPYPRATTRSNGQTVTSPRDVVDTGELRDSFVTEWKRQGKQITITEQWLAEHAAIVYLGWTSSTGLEIPPWQWMQELSAYVDLTELFQESVQEVQGG